jgi:hypothetical protein
VGFFRIFIPKIYGKGQVRPTFLDPKISQKSEPGRRCEGAIT